MSTSDDNMNAVTALVESARELQTKGDKIGALEKYKMAVLLLDKGSVLRKELETIVSLLSAHNPSLPKEKASVTPSWKVGVFLLGGLLVVGVLIILGLKLNSPETKTKPDISSTPTIEVTQESVNVNGSQAQNATQVGGKVPKGSPTVSQIIYLTIKPSIGVSLFDGPDVTHPESEKTYEEGTKMEVLGKYYDWFKVRAPDGKVGWLYKGWVTIEPSQLSKVPDIKQIPTPPLSQPTKKSNPYP